MDKDLEIILHYIKLALAGAGVRYEEGELFGALDGLDDTIRDLRAEVSELRELVDTLCEKTGTSQY